MPRYPETPKKTEASPWLNGDASAFYNHYYSRLAGVAASRYQWVGLPDEIDSMRLEQCLILQGGLAAFSHIRPKKELDAAPFGRFAVTRATYGASALDDLFNPAAYTMYGPAGRGGTSFRTDQPIHTWQGVPIWGDSLRMDYDGATIRLWANRLARASLIVDVNMAATTRGVVAVTSQDKLLSSQTTVDNMLSGITTFTSDQAAIDNIKTFDLGVHPDTVERSHVVAMRLWNEALTSLGVQAGAQEKEERLTDDEVQAIRGAVEAVRRRTLDPRRHAAKLINRRYFGGAPVVEVIDQW